MAAGMKNISFGSNFCTLNYSINDFTVQTLQKSLAVQYRPSKKYLAVRQKMGLVEFDFLFYLKI